MIYITGYKFQIVGNNPRIRHVLNQYNNFVPNNTYSISKIRKNKDNNKIVYTFLNESSNINFDYSFDGGSDAEMIISILSDKQNQYIETKNKITEYYSKLED